MKLIVCTNSNDVTPSDFAGGSQFRCHFNQVVRLPEDCEIAVHSFELCTTDQERLFLVNLLNLPVSSQVGNLRKGKRLNTVGTIVIRNPLETTDANGDSFDPKRFRTAFNEQILEYVSLENTAPINLSYLDIQLTNQDGETAVTFDNARSGGTANGTIPEQTIVLCYRKRDERN
jgi:hypothetical protein